MFSEVECMEELGSFINEGSLVIKGTLNLPCLSGTRRPWTLIRGKAVSVDEAKRIIVNEEPVFHGWSEDEIDPMYGDMRDSRGVLKNIFYRQGYNWLSTWLYSDGYVGGNLIELTRYPKAHYLIPNWVEFAKRNKNVDIIVAYTNIDECPCYYCPFNDYKHNVESLKEDRDMMFYDCTHEERARCRKLVPTVWKYEDMRYNREDVPDFYEYTYFSEYFFWKNPKDISGFVELTLHIKDGRVTAYSGEEAKALYKDYNEKYGFKEQDILYSSPIFCDRNTCICDEEFIRDCFELAGLGRDRYDETVKLKLISPVNPNATVVTRDWIIKKHKEMCDRLHMDFDGK